MFPFPCFSCVKCEGSMLWTVSSEHFLLTYAISYIISLADSSII